MHRKKAWEPEDEKDDLDDADIDEDDPEVNADEAAQDELDTEQEAEEAAEEALDMGYLEDALEEDEEEDSYH